MEKKLSVLMLICVLLMLFCGCTNEVPKFLPGQQGGDGKFVWVCEAPVAYFALTGDHGQNYYGHMKGYIEGEEGFSCFYTYFDIHGGITEFMESELWDDPSGYASFWGYAKYYEEYFEFETERDRINFFGGELPTLKFEKMPKEDFLEEYPDFENASELVG